MRNKNGVKQLNKSQSHRRAMFGNMVTSLLLHERIVTTKQKGKVLKKISEKIITRAKRNLTSDGSNSEKQLHNKRVVMKLIKNRKAVSKLFEKIAPRFKDRNGGYTRLYLLGRRAGDAAEMAIVELVTRDIPDTKKDAGKKKDIEKKSDKTKEKEKEKVKAKTKDKPKEKEKDKKSKEKSRAKDKVKEKAKVKTKDKTAGKKDKKK